MYVTFVLKISPVMKNITLNIISPYSIYIYNMKTKYLYLTITLFNMCVTTGKFRPQPDQIWYKFMQLYIKIAHTITVISKPNAYCLCY